MSLRNLTKKLGTLVVAGAAAVVVSFGTAAAATFNFTGSNPFPTSELNFSVDGINLSVTAGTFSSSSNPSNINFSSRLVDQDPDGLGADASFDSDQVDGSGGNDVLVFSFARDVRIDQITFGNVDGNDDFAYGTVDGAAFTRLASFQDVVNPFNLSLILGDNAFGIGAIGSNDNFTITSLTVTPVPLPAALPLFAGGLGLMGLLGWRRRQASA